MGRKKRNGTDPETTDGPRVGHNSELRREAIRKAFDDIYQTEKEIERQTATHLAPLKEHRTEAWRNLKTDVDIPRKVLAAEYAQYKMARDAQGNEDGGDSTLDDMREVFLALHPGEQLDWVAAVGGVARPTPQPESPTV